MCCVMCGGWGLDCCGEWDGRARRRDDVGGGARERGGWCGVCGGDLRCVLMGDDEGNDDVVCGDCV